MLHPTKPFVNFSLLLFILLIFALVGCTAIPAITPEANKSTPAAAALIPLKVAIAPYLSYAPFYIAEDQGYFKEEGLDVELVRVPRSTDSIAALAQGQIDVAGFPISSALLNAVVRNSGIKFVASKERHLKDQCAYAGFVARKGLAVFDPSAITPELLKSLRYDITPTSMNGYQLDLLLQRYGLSLDDINVVDAPNAATSLQLMQQGGLDVANMLEPFVTQAKATGAGDVWVPVNDLTPDTQSVVVAYGPTILKENPEAGKRFMVAYLKGVRTFAQGMNDATLALMAKKLELDRDLVSQMCAPYIPSDGSINAQSIIDFSKWAAAKNFIDAPVTTDMFWDSTYVDYANQVLKDAK